MPRNTEHPLYSALSESAMFRDYQHAFTRATGLPLTLREPGSPQGCASPQNPGSGSPFCALMAQTSGACASCSALQKKLEGSADLPPKTLKCFAGLCETAVPVRVGDKLIAFLQTGRVFVETPNQRQFSKITRELLRLGTHVDLKQLEEAYFATRVLPRGQYESMVQLLAIFASHLAACGNQIALQRTGAESPAISRAREIVDTGFREELPLGDVARQVNMSAGYFSELFKKITGLNFIEYVARLRVEKAKNLLQNPKIRISEVAFGVGFQSLSQFNRTFHRIVGVSPSAYRTSLGRILKDA
ncbi:MAG: helix-turn-helix domain-containing protein [Opitutaceae bacterium]